MNRKGFTLIETLIVVAVMVAIATAVWITVLRAIRFAKQDSVKEVSSLVCQQLERRYKLQGGFPNNQDEFEAFLQDTRYFQDVPVNSAYNGAPVDGWKWDASTRTLSAVNNAGKTVYSVAVPVPEGNKGNGIYARPSSYGGDG